MVGLKQEEQLQVYAAGRMRFVRAYPIQAASGEAGPKLREGDGQVPEGIYRIESLNLFVLAADTGAQNITVILSPVDFRTGKVVPAQPARRWVESLYASIRNRLREPPEPG